MVYAFPRIYKAVSEVLDHLSCVSNVEAFHKKLQLCTLNKKSKEKKLTNISKEVTKPKVHENESNDIEDYDQTCKNISYDQLISLLNETYTITLNSNGSALHAAKKIVRIASSFFLKQSIIKYEENTKNFMSEYFYTNYRNLVEKYGADQNENAAIKAINECKLQAGLILEMELLFPSSEESNCVKSITSFLGIMSFYSGATSLVKFIQEDLLGSYGHKLYNLLVEIADELCISLNKDDDSSEGSNSEASPISMNENISSLSSSALSYKSSASSKSDGRKLIRKRSDISISSKKRQILLPHKSPKRKRHSFASENIPIRYSPRLATKKKKEKLSKSAENDPKNVRRNLFSRDKKPQTPRTNRFYSGSPFKKKKIITTPKSHHVLKTNFVPNTPSHKQNQSALQRRKSQIDVCSEIAESPTVSRNAKDKNKLLMLQELKEKSLPSTSYAQPGSGSKSMPNSSVTQYTPESKRRLSLKLFSKLLASPTARMGIKKCSKRLFDQVTPHSPTTPSKRIKHDEQYENTNKEKNQNISSEQKKSQ
ncbi:uncharacterized protein CEXT_788571 [Caerostris extrusa]|uniref:Treslin STD domain-containing protein n=1 Tax=Caerostris extrusa TaxID=172846 RepID=A0AAV4NRV4_CAEEX|nr:uncharacterized protein CEXT_788571 [Caerostris extrusa]